jgi:hypothetical protein
LVDIAGMSVQKTRRTIEYAVTLPRLVRVLALGDQIIDSETKID